MRMFSTIALLLLALAAAPEARAYDPAFGNCTPAGVGVFSNRVHVHCTVPISGISYFVQFTSDATRANQTLAAMLTAVSTGAVIGVRFDLDDTSGAAGGCLVADCRLIDWFEVGQPPAAIAARPVPAIAMLTVPEPSAALGGVTVAAALLALARRRSG